MKKYQFRRNGQEWLSTLLCGSLLFSGLGVLFYRHIAGVLCLMGLLPVYIRLDRIRREKQYQEELTIQFKDALQSMTGALQAGYSLERAVPYAAEELTQLYREDAPMVRALQELTARLGLSEETVEALRELAGSGNEGVLTAVDDAVWAVIGAVCAVYGEVLPLAEQLSRIAGEALALTKEDS